MSLSLDTLNTLRDNANGDAPALQSLPLSAVIANPDQPRKLFDVAKLEELAASIRLNGLMQPIKVRPIDGGRFMIVAGERRFRAHCLLAERGQLGAVPSIDAIVEEMDEAQMDIEAIIENLQRADVTPMEEARAFQRMLDRGISEEDLARQLGMSQAWRIRERTRLLNLSPENVKLFETGNLSGEAVFEISRLADHADQAKIVKLINRGQLSGYKSIKAAVGAIIDGLSQSDIFGAAGVASEAELATVKTMEEKINRVASMVSAGWKNGECVVARKVAADRARLMADKLKAIQAHCRQMENELREAAAQAMLVSL